MSGDNEQLKRIENAVRGTSISNRTEWLVLVPVLLVMIFGFVFFVLWTFHSL